MTDIERWRDPAEPPTSPLTVLLTVLVETEPTPTRVVTTAYYMDGQWVQAWDIAGWQVLAWRYLPDPFEGEWT